MPTIAPKSEVASLVGRFEEAARAAAATVEQIPYSAAILARAIAMVEPKADRIAIAAPLDLPNELFALCNKLPGGFVPKSRQEFASAEVGVTDAFAGIAHSGSICVTVDHESAGYVSLLTRVHIAVLAAKDIVERPGDLFRPDCLEGKGLKRNFVFITGPSCTADMGPLVRGVHGPHRLHIIILN